MLLNCTFPCSQAVTALGRHVQ